MNIVTSINKNFIQHFCAMAASVLTNNHSKKINFFILHKDLTEDDEKYILECIKIESLSNFTLKLICVDDNILGNIPIVTKYLSVETLYRILLAEILPESIDRLIYLDSDLIVEVALDLLYNLELAENHYLAAVADLNETLAYNIGLKNVQDYFNSGVMLVDLDKWRVNNFTEKCLNFAHENKEKLIFPDQDILNGVLQGNWLHLDYNWNVTRLLFDDKNAFINNGLDIERDKVIKNPYIIHYTTAMKPWKYVDNHPLKGRYFYYLNKTNYSYVKYPEKECIQSEKILIFGASVAGLKQKNHLQMLGIEIIGFVDNDEKKWGEKIDNITIYSPTQLKELKFSKIIVASMYWKEISTQLKAIGFEQNLDFYNSIHDFVIHYR